MKGKNSKREKSVQGGEENESGKWTKLDKGKAGDKNDT